MNVAKSSILSTPSHVPRSKCRKSARLVSAMSSSSRRSRPSQSGPSTSSLFRPWQTRPPDLRGTTSPAPTSQAPPPTPAGSIPWPVPPAPLWFQHNTTALLQLARACGLAGPSRRPPRAKRFSCPECGSSFSNKGQLRGHARIHTGERPFACPHEGCLKTFTRNEELTRHRRIHSGAKPFPCPLCHKRFGRKDHLKKHVRTHRVTTIQPPYPILHHVMPPALLRHHIQRSAVQQCPVVPLNAP